MALKKTFPAPTGAAISSVDSRADLAGLVVRSPAGVPRAGVFRRDGSAIVTSRASMGVDVAAFEAVLVRSNLPAFIANDGAVTVAIGSAPATNSQYKIVYVKQNENSSPFADGDDLPIFDFVQGASSASPSLATAIALVPAGGLALAAVLVPSSATTTQSGGVVITQVHPFTAMTGGVIPVRDAVERLAGSWVEAQLLWQIDIDFLFMYDGSVYDTVTPAEWPVIPDSSIGAVTSGGGTPSVDASGLITCAAVTGTLKIPGVVPTEGDVVIEIVGDGGGTLQMQMMLGTTVAATSNTYTAEFDQETSGGHTGATVVGTSGIVHNVGSPIEVDATVKIKRGGAVDQTLVRAESQTPTSTSVITTSRAAFRHNVATAYNGVAFLFGSAFSGTIRVTHRRR